MAALAAAAIGWVALLVGVPVAIVYNLFLDRFISGITGAAIK